MSVKLFELDVTNKVLPQGGDSAQQGLDQVLARSIVYELADATGQFSPFLSNGYLGSINWRDEDIVEQNNFGGRNFAGQIRDAGTSFNRSGFVTYVQALDNIAAFLDAQVIVGTASTTTTASTSNHQTHTLHANGGSQGDVLYFGDQIVPQFRVTNADSHAGHTDLTLDRNLGLDIANGTTINLLSPVSKTVSEHLYDALTTIITDTNKYGVSWSSFDALDVNKKLTVFLSAADGVSYRDYISQLLVLGAFQLTVSDAGIIDITRNRNWDGSAIAEQFTLDEIVGDYKISFDTTGTFEKFQVPYLHNNASSVLEVRTSIETADSSVIATYKNRGVFSPLPIASGEQAQYNLIFSDAASADYYLALYKANYSYPRIVIQCSSKGFPSREPGRPYQIVLGQQFMVSIPLSIDQYFIQEPCIVTGYTIQRDTQLISNMTLMLTNRLYPNTTRTIDSQPVINSASGIGSSKLRIDSSEGTVLVQVRNYFTKEIVYDSEIYCPSDITINAPLSDYEVQLVSVSRIYKTNWTRFTLS